MRYILLAFLFSMSLQIAAQNPPIILCAEETPNSWVGLTWMNDHNCGASFTLTNIYQATSLSGPYSQIASLSDPNETNFVDESAANFDTALFYYVEHDCSGTVATSDTLSTLAPSPSTISSVSVVDGNVEINWVPGDFPESFGTAVFRFINGGPTVIQSVMGLTNTQATDTTAIPSNIPETYDLATIDGCGNIVTFSGLPHSTMRLIAIGDSCDGQLSFVWSPYQGWDNIVTYRLLKDELAVGVVDAQMDTLSFDYPLAPSEEAETCFVIEAENNDGLRSFSNELCFEAYAAIDTSGCIVGIDASTNASIEVYPNPFSESISVNFPNVDASEITIKVYSINGIEVYQNRFRNGEPIDLAALSSGLYHLLFTSNGKLVGFKNLVKK